MDVETYDDDMMGDFGSPTAHKHHSVPYNNSQAHNSANLFGSFRGGELHMPPVFMVDSSHESALDSVVKWMISPNPDDRPTIHQVLNSEGVRWAQRRRRAGATVFEGNWGPADRMLADDAEMIDV